MKTIFLSLLLFISVNAQSELLTLFDGGYKNTETTLYLTAQTVTGTQATRIDNFVTMLKDSLSITALSSKFDIFYLLANETSTLALRNLVKRSHDATVLDTPVYAQWEGYAGNSASDGLNTNFNPSTQGSSYTLNSASMGLYSRTNSTTSGYTMGGSIGGANSTQIRLKVTTSNEHRFSLNSINSEVTTYTGSTAGLFIITRNSSTEILEYYNGSILDTAGTVYESTTVMNLNAYILCRNVLDAVNTPDTRQIAVAFMGSKLTAGEISKLNNCIEWYMDAIGKGVIP